MVGRSVGRCIDRSVCLSQFPKRAVSYTPMLVLERLFLTIRSPGLSKGCNRLLDLVRGDLLEQAGVTKRYYTILTYGKV